MGDTRRGTQGAGTQGAGHKATASVPDRVAPDRVAPDLGPGCSNGGSVEGPWAGARDVLVAGAPPPPSRGMDQPVAGTRTGPSLGCRASRAASMRPHEGVT
jgi:hypothetical protein